MSVFYQAFDRSMTDLLCHTSFFSCKDDTLNVLINHNNMAISVSVEYNGG